MIGKKRKAAISLLGAAMTAALSLTMMPATVSAEDPESSLDNLVMNKTVQLEDDGTYTINLEAYAKGQVSTETVRRVVPADIVLVLDQSGSMTQSSIDGIPSDTYTEVTDNLTNGQVAEGTYYYRVGDNYYPIIAEQETIGVETRWLGQDGNYYTADELSYSWSRKYDGQVYNTATPFVTSSLKTFTRDHNWLGRFWYVNDDGSGEESRSGMTAALARTWFENEYKTDSTTVEFHNDGAPGGGDTDGDDLHYVAAVYTAVTREEVRTYRYTYSYINENGQQITIGTSEGSATDPCTVRPLYTRGTTSGQRLDALKYAADRFVDSIRSSAIANDVDHRVAVVGFASDEYQGSWQDYYYSNTELFIGANQYNYAAGGRDSTYNQRGDLASDHYGEAFQSVNSAQGYQNLQASVNALTGRGATYPSLGFEMANGIFNANDNTYVNSDGTSGERSRIVVFLTDGEPGDNGYDRTEANNTLNQVNITKNTYGATVYTVAVLDSNPTTGGNIDTFLKNTSSDGSYTLATSTEALDDFFQTIDDEINNVTTTVTLSENSILVDRLSEYFVVPDDFSIANNVTVQTARHTGYEAFANPTAAPAGIQAELSYGADNTIRGITVRGFNFVSEGENGNLVTTSVSGGGSTIATGSKLVVTIKGVLAKDEAATNTYIDTNLPQSGIWDTDEDGTYGMVKAFNQPNTLIAERSYVLDYAKEAELDVFDTSTDRLDSAEDEIFSRVGEENTSVTGSYGTSSAAQQKLTYTPSTTNWNGFDSVYALGKDGARGDARTHNMWTKVNVIPANNVYYEDDFITNESTGTVGIQYNQDGWTVDGSSAGNTETANNDVHGGWIEGDQGLSDDTGYSDGSAHMGGAGATATFTFTGTGVDVYSRTDMSTGYVVAQLYAGEETTAAALTQSLVVDNLSESGTYYQIPTVSFAGLDHGTYTVKLTVASTSDQRSTYYIDGIRVYNPLSSEQEADSTVSDAYGDEAGAVFTEVRDILIDSADVDDEGNPTRLNGAVFLDKHGDSTEGTYSVGEYFEYGPKNEVYLAKDQAILVATGNEGKIAIGLKAPEGTASVQMTNGENTSSVDITAASDLYYEVTANETGYVMIRNTGDNLLAVTKIKMSGMAEITALSLPDVLSYANEFESLPTIDYTQGPAEDDQTESMDPSGPSDTEEGDVVIDNPEETPDQGDTPVQERPIATWLDKLINGIKNLFGRW